VSLVRSGVGSLASLVVQQDHENPDGSVVLTVVAEVAHVPLEVDAVMYLDLMDGQQVRGSGYQAVGGSNESPFGARPQDIKAGGVGGL
jgi:hypothetical protein